MKAYQGQTRKERMRNQRQQQKRIKQAFIAVLVLAGAILVGLGLAAPRQNTGKGNSSTVVQDRLSHQILDLSQSSTWEPNADNLPELIAALNLPYSDPPQLHHHIHLDLYVNGRKVIVPAQIGLSSQVEVPVHTHDPSGIIHIETVDINFKPTLGLFFDVWGVTFTTNSIGGYTSDANNQLSVYVNGKLYQGDPREIPLNQHDEIVIAYGTESQRPSPIPSTYEFSNGE